MLFLVCLFFATYSYGCEDSTLLEVVVENDSFFLKKAKTQYNRDNEEYLKDNQVHFYNLAAGKVQSFQSNELMKNLFPKFQKKTKLSDIKQLPQIQLMLQEHRLYHSLLNKLNALFKSLDRLYFPEDKHFKKKILYHFKLLLYTIKSSQIELNQDASIRTNGYEDFLRSTKQCTFNAYDRRLQSDKKDMLCFNVFATVFCGTFGIGLSVASPEHASVLLPVFGSPLLLSCFVTGAVFFENYFAYKNFLKIIEELQQDIQNE